MSSTWNARRAVGSTPPGVLPHNKGETSVDELTLQLQELCRLRVRGWTVVASAIDELKRLRVRVMELEGAEQRREHGRPKKG